eukprot:4712533-Amphidinium_carterae.1
MGSNIPPAARTTVHWWQGLCSDVITSMTVQDSRNLQTTFPRGEKGSVSQGNEHKGILPNQQEKGTKNALNQENQKVRKQTSPDPNTARVL